MPYSFESWRDAENQDEQEIHREFPFSEDLKELEESLSMGLSDVIGEADAGYFNDTPLPSEAGPLPVPDEARWDELAKAVADHVITYMQEVQNPLYGELERQRRVAEEYLRDNRVMARQVQDLISEREELRRRLQAYELEVMRYRPVLGNLHVRL